MFVRTMFVSLSALVLGACGSDGSQPAQRAPDDLRLAQCELVDGTVLGEPMDPVMIDGVATQACRITDGHIAGGSRVDLKASHQYQPLVWVLDGRLEIGDSRTYATLDEFVNAQFAQLGSVLPGRFAPLRATAGSMIVVHRNGYFNGDVVSHDADLEGSGEWGGIVVNNIGWHPDCPAPTSADSFCNVPGPHGYYGGLPADRARTEVIGLSLLPSTDASGAGRLSRLGFEGSVSEAGGAVAGGEPLAAAVVLNAPQSLESPRPINVLGSAGAGIELNGGYTAGLPFVTQNAQGSAVYWHHDFAGSLRGVSYHSASEHAALRGVGGDVDLNGITLIDRDFAAGTAISVQGGHVDLTNVLVQNFRGCLQMDASAGATLTGVAFGCLQPTVAADDGTDHAAGVVSAALQNSGSHYYQADPGLTPDLQVGNAELTYDDWSNDPGGKSVIDSNLGLAGRDLRLIYPDCMGIGTLLPESQTVTVERTTYRICQLSGTIDSSARVYTRFNGGNFAWVLDGNVSLGADFSALSEAEQLAALESPGYLFMQGGTRIFGRAGATLTVQPSMQWLVAGNAADPVEITALPGATARWAGVRVYGVDRAECQTGSNAGICAHAGARQLSIKYLRLLQAGQGEAALQLHEVGPGATVDYLAIVNSASTGLALHGGRANLNHVVLDNSAGDQLLWEQGYRGTIQYGLFTSGAASTGQVLHGRNDSADHDASPRSQPTLANLTITGQGIGTAILLEQGSGMMLQNSVVVDFATCLDIDDPATAALQASTPQAISLTDVAWYCEAVVANEDEDGGLDYGHLVASSSSVYDMDPLLDESFVATNPTLPAPAAGFWGAIGAASEGWYLGWSGVGVLLSPECDGKGTLVDDYRYRFSTGTPFGGYPIIGGNSVDLYYKVCRLPGVVTKDTVLTRYTGADTATNADGFVEITESGRKYNPAFRGDVSWVRVPVPTIWLLDGTVTVGRGGAQLSALEDVTTLKTDPVELTMQPGTWVMATDDGGLHVTRGARLRILGEPMLEDEVCEPWMYGWACFAFPTTGPVSMFGEMVDQIVDGVVTAPLPSIEITYTSTGEIETSFFNGDYIAYAPLGMTSFNGDYRPYASAWRGITVDGFARNNQCEEAVTAEPDSRICNIDGELGYHGGYDDAYANVDIHNLYMMGGLLRLNSVAGVVEGLNYQYSRFSDQQVGDLALVEIDGGAANLREVLLDLGEISGSRKPGTLIGWNHGYRGSMQYIYGNSAQVADGSESRTQGANGRDYFIPLLRGANGDLGHEDDLPRSLPTIANLSLRSDESDSASGQMTSAIDSSLIELVRGSGLHLHHSVMGATEGDNRISDYCFKLDDSVVERLSAGEVVVRQLATSCQALSDNAGISFADMSGVNNGYAGSMAVFAFSSEQQYVDLFGPDPIQVYRGYDRYYPVQAVVDDYGHVELDVSASPTADTEFLHVTEYLGTVDYWIRPW